MIPRFEGRTEFEEVWVFDYMVCHAEIFVDTLLSMVVCRLGSYGCSFDVMSFEVSVEVIHILSYEAVISEDCKDSWVVIESDTDLLIERGERKEQS